MGSPQIIDALLDKINILVDGGQLIQVSETFVSLNLQAAIQFEKNDMLDYYIKKGASVDSPPDTVSKLYIDHSRTSEYRKSPFILQAACQGALDVFENLLHHGCKITDQGFIGFSKKRKNQVISNIVGAAAFNGSKKILQFMLKKKSLAGIDHLASERLDFAAKTFSSEYTGYTPLMLAVAAGGQNIDCVKVLVQNKADLSVLDPIGNNVFHIAALNQNSAALEFLLEIWPKQSLSFDLTLRNKNGETPYSIAYEQKSDRMLKILEQYQQTIGDLSQQTTQDLLDDLLKEELKLEQDKAKRKDKKKRQKIKHIAEKEGISVEEIQSRHEAENKAKEIENQIKLKEEEERVRRDFDAAADEQRRRQERERQLYSGPEDEHQPTSILHHQTGKDKKKGASSSSKHVKFADAPLVAPVVKQQEVETTFAHLKVKKPDLVAQPVKQVAAVVSEVEVPKASLIKTSPLDGPNRKQRKKEQYLKDSEQRIKSGVKKPTPEAVQTEAAAPVETSKPEEQKKAADNDSDDTSDNENGGRDVLGVSAELRMKTLSTKARQRLRRKLVVEQAEEEARKEKLKKHFEEIEADKKRKEEEEVKKKQEEYERLRQEKAEKKKVKEEKKTVKIQQHQPVSAPLVPQSAPAYRQKAALKEETVVVHEESKVVTEKPQKKEKKPTKEVPQYRPKQALAETVQPTTAPSAAEA